VVTPNPDKPEECLKCLKFEVPKVKELLPPAIPPALVSTADRSKYGGQVAPSFYKRLFL